MKAKEVYYGYILGERRKNMRWINCEYSGEDRSRDEKVGTGWVKWNLSWLVSHMAECGWGTCSPFHVVGKNDFIREPCVAMCTVCVCDGVHMHACASGVSESILYECGYEVNTIWCDFKLCVNLFLCFYSHVPQSRRLSQIVFESS